MGYSSKHVLRLFWMNLWNMSSLPTQAQQGNWQADKGQVRLGIWQENCCGYRRKQLTTPSNFDRFQRHSMWQTLEQRLWVDRDCSFFAWMWRVGAGMSFKTRNVSTPNNWKEFPKQFCAWALPWKLLGVSSLQDLELWHNSNVQLWTRTTRTHHGSLLQLWFWWFAWVFYFQSWHSERGNGLTRKSRRWRTSFMVFHVRWNRPKFNWPTAMNMRLICLENWMTAMPEQRQQKTELKQSWQDRLDLNRRWLKVIVPCVRYGFMEIGGFVRNAKLTAEQYRHIILNF